MNYEKIWNKILSSDEKAEYEFSIGSRYIKFNLIIWGIISLPFLFIAGFGIIIFLIALFYYGFYLKAANAYAFTNKRVLIHKGWLSTRTTSIDYSKIIETHIEESFLDRVITHTGHMLISTIGTTSDRTSSTRTTSHGIILKHIESPYEVKKKLDILKDK